MPIITPEGAIVSLLNASATVKGIVAGRIHPATDPTAYVRPKMYFQRIGTNNDTSNDGPLNLQQARIYLYASADDLATAKALAIAARTALAGFSGTVDGFEVGCIRITDEDDETTPLEPGQAKPPQRVRLEATIDFYS